MKETGLPPVTSSGSSLVQKEIDEANEAVKTLQDMTK